MAAIYIKNGDALIEMTQQPYDAERVLQQLLADHPDLLAGEQDGDARKRWLLVSREIAIGADPDAGGRWSLDHLFVDQDGVPTLVEVKRSSDTRIRREVVGQMLDYAANAPAYWSIDQIRGDFERTQRACERDPDDVLATHLGHEDGVDEFWRAVDANLRAGRLRLVFVADEIPSELARIVEFLNGQMPRTDVLAIEVRQYTAPGSELVTLVPRVIGQTEAARDAKRVATGRSTRKWGEEDLFRHIRDSTDEAVAERAIALFDFMIAEGGQPYWGSGANPSVTVWLGSGANYVSLSFYGPSVAVNFAFVREHRGVEGIARLAGAMRTVPGVAGYLTALEAKDFRLRPGMRSEDVLGSDEALEAWKRALVEAATPSDSLDG